MQRDGPLARLVFYRGRRIRGLICGGGLGRDGGPVVGSTRSRPVPSHPGRAHVRGQHCAGPAAFLQVFVPNTRYTVVAHQRQ